MLGEGVLPSAVHGRSLPSLWKDVFGSKVIQKNSVVLRKGEMFQGSDGTAIIGGSFRSLLSFLLF